MWKITLEGGTDAAEMVVFDPGALPDDFDSRREDDPAALLEELHEAGRLFWIDAGGDGAYRLGVCLGDKLPDDLQAHVVEQKSCEQFALPSGRLYFTGAEYVFRSDDSFLREFPGMGASIELDAGTYQAELCKFRYPPKFHRQRLKATLPFPQYVIYRSMVWLGCLGFLSVPALLFSLTFLDGKTWATTAVPAALLLILWPLLLARTATFKAASRAASDLQKQYPSFGLRLNGPLPSSAAL